MRHIAILLGALLACWTPQSSAQTANQTTVRFGVFELFHPGELELSPAGPHPLRVTGLPHSLLLNGEPGKRRLRLRASGDRVVLLQDRSATLQVSARDGSIARFDLGVPGKLHRVFEGTLTITASHGELIAIVSVERELAVAAIVASEMPVDAPLEALKAQAVVTRSFLSAGPRHAAFDFCDTTHCQYFGSPEHVTARVRAAVESTRGEVLNWHRQVIAALYSSRCGGQTQSSSDAGMPAGSGYPYYSVPCAWCREHPVQWRTHLPAGSPIPQSGSEPSRIAHARQWGWSALPGNHFTIHQNDSGILVEGHSIGHGVGLCQLGAMGMAAAGADFRSILSHFYPNSELAQLPSQGE